MDGLFAVTQLVRLYNQPAGYALAKNGRITNYEQDIAYVIRDEELVDTSEYVGERQINIYDNNRAAQGDVIAYFIQENNDEQKKEINSIDLQIQEIMKGMQLEYSQDVKNVEKSLESNLYDLLKDKEKIHDLNNKKTAIDELLEKKVKYIASSNGKGSELNELVNKRMALEKEIAKNKVSVKASKAGLVSYRVDGYEESLKPEDFLNITVDMLKNIKSSTNQLIPITTDKIKIINNFYAYLVVVTKSEEGTSLKLNDTVKYTLGTDLNNLSKATVDYIIKDGDTKYVFLRTTDNIEKLSQYRKLNVNIVWWDYQGIKLPNEAIYDDEIKDAQGNITKTLKAISVQGVTGYKRKVWVKVDNQVGGFSIVSNFEDAELEELGLNKELIDDRNRLNLYDKVLIEN
ncbi:MAG: hypothetical protein IKI57_05755 [Clostridia bacterium]|nr:hypothetical protein [Clostridia bacterium]